jgi:DNA-binding transcriptional MerR regulator
MNEKEKLLSIGEISKMTGAGIKALRHYEKINILKPVYVDPFTGYRYYSFSQTYVVELIKFAVELDIPLKGLTEYVDGEGNLDFEAFIAKGNKVVRNKLEILERALKFFDSFNENLALQKKYKLNEIYIRKLPRKYFYCLPYEKSFDDADKASIAKLFLDIPFDDETGNDDTWVEYGFLSEYSDEGIRRYVFIEMPKDTLLGNSPFERKIVPAGRYHCRRQNHTQIEQAAEIFKEHLGGNQNFIAVETEIFLGNFNINNPLNELRVICR